MDELEKINAKVARMQNVRLVGGIGCMILGIALIGRYTSQRGITEYQRYMSKVYPDEYASITKKVVEVFENK